MTRYEYCVVVVSEGARYADGKFIAEAGGKDAFGHAQLGGVAATIAQLVRASSATSTIMQSRTTCNVQHATSHRKVDVDQAYAVGKAAVELALAGENAVMPIIVRKSEQAVSLDDRQSGARQGREQGKDDAAQLHQQRRFLDHGGVPALLGAARPGRGLSAVSRTACRVMSALRNRPVPRRLWQRVCAKVAAFRRGRRSKKN